MSLKKEDSTVTVGIIKYLRLITFLTVCYVGFCKHGVERSDCGATKLVIKFVICVARGLIQAFHRYSADPETALLAIIKPLSIVVTMCTTCLNNR